MTPFECYKQYLALRAHFTQDSYDYTKYNGAVRANQQSFETRRDRYLFYKLSKKDDIFNRILSNILVKKDAWVGDVISEKGEKNYIEWKKRQESIEHVFKTEIQDMDLEELKDSFAVKNGEHPKLLQMYMQGYLSIETLLILNSLLKFIPKWNKNIDDDIIWPEVFFKLKKYRKFITIDEEKYLSIMEKIYYEG